MPETQEVEPETIDGEVVEEDSTDERPTLAEYEQAKETIRTLLQTGSPETAGAAETVEAEERVAYEIVERAERLGIRPSQSEADTTGVTVAMLPAIRDAVTTTEIERAHPIPAAHALPTKLEWEAAMAVAREIAKTQFVPKEIRGKPDQVLACILSGRELGIGPMEALRKIHMIDGRPAFAAELMLSLMRKGGVVLLETETTMERARIKAKRSDTGETTTVEFTWEEAQLIDGGKLVKKSNWLNYRQDMLWARCVSRLGRRLAPDLLGGMSYSAEEVQDFDDEGGYSSMGVEGIAAEQAVNSVTFRPGVDLLSGAPRNFEDTAKLLNALDNQMDWAAWGSEARQAIFNEPEFKNLSEEQRIEFGKRMANTATYLRDTVMEGKDFPPPTHDEVRKAFAWAFEGATLTGPEEAEPAEQAELQAMAAESRPRGDIDPGVDLLPNAIAGSGDKEIAVLYEAMTTLNSDIDWSALITACVAAQFEVEDRTKLTKKQRDEWWLRLRNAVAHAQAAASDGPATTEQIDVSFKWAFPAFADPVPVQESGDAILSGDEAERLDDLGDVGFGGEE